jgi:hypothetical protein
MRLIIRCPVRPVAYNAEDWSSQDLYFLWAQSTATDFNKDLDLDALPVADSVVALIPDIDMRLIALKVPAVSDKKITQLLPMLIEDELLSSVSDTSIQLLPPMLNLGPDQRLVSVINRDWLLWLSQKLSVINCENIQLIPESMLLPAADSMIYYQQEDATNYYTLKKSSTDILCWSQPTTEPILSVDVFNTQPELLALSAPLLMRGIALEKKSYEGINVLPEAFFDFRRERQSELQHWLSKDLWKAPLKWSKYAVLTLCVSYLCYLLTLVWQDQQWDATLKSATNQVLSEGSNDQASFTKLVNASCLAAHKNLENCRGDFERQLLALQDVLKNTPPDALKGLEYSKKGIVFVLEESKLSNTQRLALAQEHAVKRLGSARYLLSPYADLAYD